MKRLVIFGLLFLTGCGGLSTSMPLPSTETITWNDGNPCLAPCSTAKVNCKSGYQILDNENLESLPLTTTSYTGVKSHTYQIRATGIDGLGKPIYSNYITVIEGTSVNNVKGLC